MRSQIEQICVGSRDDSSSKGDSNHGSHDNSGAALGGRSLKRSGSFKSFLPGKDLSKSPVKSPKKEPKSLEEKSLKKSKSSTSLSALFSRPRSAKGMKKEDTDLQNDKENDMPFDSADAGQPPPIWAQFATTAIPNVPGTRRIPLNDCGAGEEELNLGTGGLGSPSKSRSRRDEKLPDLSRSKTRPRSECLPSDSSWKTPPDTLSGLRRSTRHKEGVKSSAGESTIHQEDLLVTHKHSSAERNHESIPGKRRSRVLEAAAFFNQKNQHSPTESTDKPAGIQLDPATIEVEFEALLDIRNIPFATKEKMRSLDSSIKADLVKQDKATSGSSSSTDGLAAKSTQQKSKRPENSNSFEDDEESKGKTTPKKSRPRSLTFTFSKGDQSPSKRQKSESHQRTKSGEVTPSAPSRPSSPAVNGYGLSLFKKVDNFALPKQVIGFLRKVEQPQDVEVGKIQKLRQLLRNETVGWVDELITQGGMTEIIELLYRTMAVEWREEHEDVLLHETLLCLKALSTTSSAMAHISSIQNRLFPALLNMLFDEERKGPSEYNTRTIIFNLLHSYLVNSSTGTYASRAQNLLGYLRDQSQPQEAQAPAFITSIYHPRPYRTWHKELNNLTKEVFWIFLHHHNIISYPPSPSNQSLSYQERHFPKEHPPVGTAPYIGGVEWDATAYVTAHLDLINGLIASLSTQRERNDLRQEMKDSGFEKLMGASFRTCKEKFYGNVHEALSVWAWAAHEDGWPDKDIRQGPPREETIRSPAKKSKKKDQPPKLEMPKLDLVVDGGGGGAASDWI